MIPKSVIDMSLDQLENYLKFEAGCSNPEYFKSFKSGGLKLQQVPREYASLLMLLKESKPKTYLELGIGNGGSFAMACFMMQESLESAVAVDCLAYRDLNIGQCEEEINNFVKLNPEHKAQKTFINSTTDAFFLALEDDSKFDVIFIDADHSYEGARKDFVNSLKHIADDGLIIFHDINSDACPGIQRIWQEIKTQIPNQCTEFIHSNTCGIGVVRY